MILKEKIKSDLKGFLKEKKEIEVSVLRMLQAAIINKEKEKRNKLAKQKADLKEEDLIKESQLTDEEVVEAVSSEMKKRKEASVEFKKGGREDLSRKEDAEAEVLKKYLPEQLSEDEIKSLIKEAIAQVGASSLQDMGKVMGKISSQIKGKADGGEVSRMVKELLS